MRRNTKAKTGKCRGCSSTFYWVQGIQWFDAICCSQACYVKAGPYKPYIAATPLATPKYVRMERKAAKAKRRQGKKRRDNFYRCREWLEIRWDVLEIWGARCMMCNTEQGAMHVDHIVPRSKCPDRELDFTNLQVLCHDCNIGKTNSNKTDFRPQSQIQEAFEKYEYKLERRAKNRMT